MSKLSVIGEQETNQAWWNILEIGSQVQRNYKGYIYVDRSKIK